MRRFISRWVAIGGLLSIAALTGAAEPGAGEPGRRVLLDAHNAYPYDGRWNDRIDRALATGLPLAIEQDLIWHRQAAGGGRSVVSHGEPLTGSEPTLEQYFFERIRPLVEQALRDDVRATWPLIVLNLDLKSNEPEHHAALWALLGRYESWLTTAERRTDSSIAPLDVRPVLVLTGDSDAQALAFEQRQPNRTRLRLFGAVHSVTPGMPGAKTNYRRWWNNPWSVVEAEGQERAGAWIEADAARLKDVVSRGHHAGLWVRFYTLNGHDPADASGGWSAGYNFGSLSAVQERWNAAIRAGVDFIAVDQYETFAAFLAGGRHTAAGPAEHPDAAGVVTLDGVLTRKDYESLFEREFDVPAGTERIELELAYDERERTVLDLGLRGPSGIRGWSGGGSQHVFVATHSASFGYTPGPIEPGRWAVVLGVPNIRTGVEAKYTVVVRTSDGAELPTSWPTLRRGPAWYAGDLHAHSGHSDGRTQRDTPGRVRVPVEHAFEAAKRAGLDYLALTDHNTASHWADVDRQQTLYPGLLLLHGREVTTYRGHMNAFGERRFTDFRIGSRRSVGQLASELTSKGAFVSINHPRRPDDESCMGCGWNDGDEATVAAMQGIEVVNGSVVEGAEAGWPFWAAMLNRGHRLTAIGGSDDHSPDEASDGRIGTPTTVVYADALSESALIEGLRRGRVYIRTRGVDGPHLELSAEGGGLRYTMGDRMSDGAATLRAIVRRADGQQLEWIQNGKVVATTAVGRSASEAGVELIRQVIGKPGDWFSLVVRDGVGPTAISNAVYVSHGKKPAR